MNDMTSHRACIHGDSPMADTLRRFDWSRSELGPPGRWPPELLTAAVFNLVRMRTLLAQPA